MHGPMLLFNLLVGLGRLIVHILLNALLYQTRNLLQTTYVSDAMCQHSPTNGDPSYDFKRLKSARGVPLSMLVQDQCGSYASASGEAAIIGPDEAAVEKEMGGFILQDLP